MTSRDYLRYHVVDDDGGPVEYDMHGRKVRKPRKGKKKSSKTSAGQHAGKQAEAEQPAQLVQPIPFEHYTGDVMPDEAIENLEALPAFVHRGKVGLITHSRILLSYTDHLLQSQNTFLREWVQRRMEHLQVFIALAALAPENLQCQACNINAGCWRCRDCSGGRFLCTMCCSKEHEFNIFHRVEKWQDNCFKMGALWQVGVKLHLGHQGMKCPSRVYSEPGPDELHGADAGTENYHEAELDHDAENGAVPEPEDWEDEILEEQFDMRLGYPQILPRPNLYDEQENRFVTIVDMTGIHHLPVVQCLCPSQQNKFGNDTAHDLQWIELSMLPTSYDKIDTVFTFNTLKDF